MEVYMQAARALQAVEQGKGMLKRICLQKEVQKKRATYAVAAETMKHTKILDEVLKRSGFYEVNKTFWPWLARVMTNDVVFGKGLQGKVTTGAAYAVHKHLRHIKAAFQEVLKSRKVKTASELLEKVGAPPQIPVYLRVNTLKTDVDSVIKTFEKEGFVLRTDRTPADLLTAKKKAGAVKRSREGEDEEPEKAAKDAEGKKKKVKKKKKVQDEAEDAAGKWEEGRYFIRDTLLSSLLVFSPSEKFYLAKHRLVQQGFAFIQDKASCLPAYVLLHLLPLNSLLDKENDDAQVGTTNIGPVLDATAAPGNKTSLLCMLSRGKRTVVAVERDAERAELLEQRLDQAQCKAEVIRSSFLDLNPADYANIEGVLVDPSCSGSGMVNRVSASTDDDRGLAQRLEHLSDFQKRMVLHALSFPNVKRVVYSTCSVHREENEDVVKEVLEDEAVKGKWTLADIMPATWGTRGLPVMQNGEYCIRCDPRKDCTNGFFLACFERVPKKRSASQKRKRGGKRHQKKKKKAVEAESDGGSDAEE